MSDLPILPVHGRGASHNPPNRFETLSMERDDWNDPDDPLPQTRFYKDATRSIIATNDSPDVGFDASVNPYRGCEHGCTYCQSGETPILMADGTTRPLGDLHVGDHIYGTVRRGWYRRYSRTVILAHWGTRKKAYRVTLADGTELVASGDHRFLTLRGWKHVKGTERGRWRRPHLTLNDSLLGTGFFAKIVSNSAEYKRGYLCGMVRGDGMLQPNNQTAPGPYSFRLALTDEAGLNRTAGYLEDFGLPTRSRPFRSATANRKQMRAIHLSSREPVNRVHDLIAWPQLPSREWDRGFLAGIFDAEGNYGGGILGICNTGATIVDATVDAMRRLGFLVAIEPRSLNRNIPITYLRVRGGLKEHLRFFHTTDPAILRKRDIEGQALKSQANLRVVSIEPVGMRDLFDITTGTGDFIANGVVSHNCYARPNHEYLGLSAGLDFETRIFVKEDAPQLLRKALSAPKWEPKVIAMSGVTDAYQPVERRLQITRRCLQVLEEFRNPVGIVTKNALVTRDADILRLLAEHGAACVTLSVTSLRNEIQRVMEPRTSIPANRLKAIETLARAGIPVGVNVAPVVPGLTDHEMPAILRAAADAGAVSAGYVMLRLPFAVAGLFEQWLGQQFPDRKEKVLNRLRAMHGGKLYDSTWRQRQRGEGPFAAQVEAMFDVACRKVGLDKPRPRLSTAAFRRPEPPPKVKAQLELL